jgi:CRP-like cAMP-binding protein
MKNILFDGIAPDALTTLLGCLSARRQVYDKGEFIFVEGDAVGDVGVVLSGSVHVVKEDYWGSRVILALIGEGGLFAEAFSAAGTEKLPVSVVAAGSAEVLFIDCRKICRTCPNACSFHAKLVSNMLKILADKNVSLTEKLEHITRKTTREKLLSYLSSQAKRAGSPVFAIPFNRQELADYLSVERSAMSYELGKLRDEGVIAYRKNDFELLNI